MGRTAVAAPPDPENPLTRARRAVLSVITQHTQRLAREKGTQR